jgi:23S rRNA pseudouridine1911/1915/1917 synthase
MMNPLDDDFTEASEQEQNIELVVEDEYDRERIDKYLTLVLDDMSRSYIQKLIGEDRVYAGGKAVKANYRVISGEVITLYLPEPKELQIAPENIPIDIIYEDADIIIINKHKGLVVHPAPGHESGTLVNALLYHCKGNLSGINGVLRPGIVHRIDRDTTGVLIACKNDTAHRFIADQLKVHSITRRYQAIVYNTFKTDSGRIEATIGRHPKDRKKMAAGVKNGKDAVTNYKLIENLGNKYAYVECELETGRTHQIRVHLSSINHPILGDTVYGPDKDPFHLEGQALHAGVLGIIHPRTKEYMEFSAPLPEYFTELLTRLR